METGIVQNFVLTQYNNSDTDEEITDIQRDFGNTQLFDSTEDVSMSITRLQIPFESTEIMRIEDSNISDFTLTIGLNAMRYGGTTINGGVMPELNYAEGTAQMYKSSEMKIITPSDFIENVNKTLSRAYIEFIKKVSYRDQAAANQWYKRDWYNEKTITFTGINSNNRYCDFNFADVVAFNTSCVDIKLDIISVSNIQVTTETPQKMYIDLVSPSGKTIRVCSGVELKNLANTSFWDLYPNHFSINDDGTMVNKSCSPISAFNGFADGSNCNGTWRVVFLPVSGGYFACDFQIKLSLTARPTFWNECPPIAPFFSFNRSTKFLSMNLPEKFIALGFIIKSQGLLNRILNYSKQSSSTRIEWPIVSLSSGLNETISIEQQIPKLYLISQLERILILSNNLNINRDYIDGATSSNIITDLIVDNDNVLDFNVANYTYESSDFPMRRYKFNSNAELSRLNFSIKLRYKDGREQNLILPSGSSLIMTVSFFRVGR